MSSRVRQRSKRYSSGELGGVQAPDGLVEAREVQDDEEVVVVLVDLRALVARVDVLVVELMKLEVLLQPRAVGRARPLDVDPAQPFGLDDLDVRGLDFDLGGPGTAAPAAHRAPKPWLWKVRHD
jgi:hypothetical protein